MVVKVIKVDRVAQENTGPHRDTEKEVTGKECEYIRVLVGSQPRTMPINMFILYP
jgi:hypothetical protein